MKVLTIVEENHGAGSAAKGMPYLKGLAQRYGVATRYRSLTHPSLPNYLAMAGGTSAGVHDDAAPARHRLRSASVFDVALAHGRTATTYAESMPRPCAQVGGGQYAVKHNPWAYYSSASSRTNCARYDVPAGTPAAGRLHDAIARGTLPQVGLLVPNLCNDAHNCSLRTADAWLRSWLPVIMSGRDWRSGRLAVVVTFDEVEGGGGGYLLTAVLSPRLHGVRVGTSLSHLSWCRWMTDLAGAPPLPGAARATSLGRAFGLA
jgi:acid phosphatase